MKAPDIRVLVIDNEPKSQKRSTKILRANPKVSDVECVENSDEALLKIINNTPDIILISYPTKGNSGKELIKFIKNKLPGTTLIILSDSKDYAATAIRNGIYNYILKPVSKEKFKDIIEKVQLVKQTNIQSRINEIIENNQEDTRLRFPTTKGYLIVDPKEILFCKADGFCTELHLNNRMELSYLFLSKFEETLIKFNFLRVSRSYLINIKYIRKIYRSTNIIVLASDGKEYEVKGSKIHIRNLSKFDSE